MIVDFESIAKRNMKAKLSFTNTTTRSINSTPATGRLSYFIKTSVDNVNYSNHSSDIDMRYVKLEIHVTFNTPSDIRKRGSGGGILRLYEIYDSNVVGGNAKLSFLIKTASGHWVTLIPYTEFGTITQGGAIVKQLGESVSNYILPSSQSLLKARLEVTDSIETGVSIIKVA